MSNRSQMMFPLIVADAPLADLIRAFDGAFGMFSEPRALLSESEMLAVAGSVIWAGERDGISWLIEGDNTVAYVAFSALVAVSQEIAGTVTAVCAAPRAEISVCRATRGKLERLFLHCPELRSQPFSIGESLPSESNAQLTDVSGIKARINDTGFNDTDLLDVSGRLQHELWTEWSGDSLDVLRDPLRQQIFDHQDKYPPRRG